MSNSRTIVIFVSAKSEPSSLNYRWAYDLGKRLAQAGYALANGGYGGSMAAASQGAHEAGVCTIGVTCSAFGRSGANQWIEKEIQTHDLYERLKTLIGLGDAYVVLPGSTGTLLELAACWELMNKGFLPRVPIICLSDYWKPIRDTIVNFGETTDQCLHFAETIDDVIQILSEHFSDSQTIPKNRKSMS